MNTHPPSPRALAYVLAATDHGTMIVNRNDHHRTDGNQEYGVGHRLLATGSYAPKEIGMVRQLLSLRHQAHGAGVLAIDGGANIGVQTVEWARHMNGWGTVLAFEPQERVYYALAGNIAINNCWNASARCCALGATPGEMAVPVPDYLSPGSFGSLELKASPRNEFIGQAISYDPQDCRTTPVVSIDALSLRRLDFLKLDIEGMEMEALMGCEVTLRNMRPMLLVEIVKAHPPTMTEWLQARGYRCHQVGMNLLALHMEDPCAGQVQFVA